MQIGSAEPSLTSFLFVYGENLGGHGFVMALYTNALHSPLDSARGELPSDTRTLIFHREMLGEKSLKLGGLKSPLSG